MKKIFLTIAIFITVNNYCFSLEEIPITTSATEQNTVNQKDNLKTVIHFHPITLFTSIPELVSDESPSGLYYLTIEKPLNLSNSLIIKPSLVLNVKPITLPIMSFGKRNDDIYFRLGSDIGLRHYVNKNGQGVYKQGTVGVFFIENRIDNSSFMGIDIMGNLGFSKKYKTLTIFFDIGLGVGNSNVMMKDRNEGIRDVSIIYDINFGLGFKF